jgi:hypothetical protein
MKTLVLCLCVFASSVCVGQQLPDNLPQPTQSCVAKPFGGETCTINRCGDDLSFHECRAFIKLTNEWCKQNNIKGFEKCSEAYDAEVTKRRLAKEQAEEKAKNEEQVKIDKAAMDHYAQYGKPTGLSFTEWKKVQIDAWKADSKTDLSFADWLNSHLSQGNDK